MPIDQDRMLPEPPNPSVSIAKWMYKFHYNFRYYYSITNCQYQLCRITILQICNNSSTSYLNRHWRLYRRDLFCFSGRFNNQLLYRSNYTKHKYRGNL